MRVSSRKGFEGVTKASAANISLLPTSGRGPDTVVRVHERPCAGGENQFANRAEAGRALARRLNHLRGEDAVVLAVPRGGVPVGFEVARTLGAPLDLLIVRKIGAPGYPELAVGAGVGGAVPRTVLNDNVLRELAVPADYVERTAARELAEIERRRALYGVGRPPVPLDGRTAVVVDDGIATGATVRVALQALAASGTARRVVLRGAPSLHGRSGRRWTRLCDEVIILLRPRVLGAVGSFYDDFRQNRGRRGYCYWTERPADVDSAETSVRNAPPASAARTATVPVLP